MAKPEGPQAPPIPQGAPDPQAPPAPPAPQEQRKIWKQIYSGQMIGWILIDLRKMIKFKDCV